MIQLIILASLFLVIAALVDVLQGQFRNNDKLIWVLVVLLAGPLGAILYYVIGRKQKLN